MLKCCLLFLRIKRMNKPNYFVTYSYIEDVQFFGMNMTFISLSEAKNLYFMSGEAILKHISLFCTMMSCT